MVIFRNLIMAISFNIFLQWVESHFDDIKVKGEEIRLNSIFTDDKRHHLWCSPTGGKRNRPNGVYHCFKTDQKGTLVGLVKLVEKCSYSEAQEILSGLSPSKIDEELNEIFKSSPKVETLKLPDGCCLASLVPEAVNYLTGRKLPVEGLYYHEQRIIIPYYDRFGKLVYWNGRHIGDSSLRYLGPSKAVGIGKSDVLYCPCWQKGKIYLVEGEFDALSLYLCGFNGVACGGKYLDDKQIELLRGEMICLCLDNDASGLNGVIEMGNRLILNQFMGISYVRPPKGIKDWNKMLILFNEGIVKAWIDKNEKIFDEFSGDFLKL